MVVVEDNMPAEANASAAESFLNMARLLTTATVPVKRRPLRRIATAEDTPQPPTSTKMANGLGTMRDAATPDFI
jgi:hypothetical protein